MWFNPTKQKDTPSVITSNYLIHPCLDQANTEHYDEPPGGGGGASQPQASQPSPGINVQICQLCGPSSRYTHKTHHQAT